MDPYQTRTLEGASGVELTIALYDGIIRFMYRAIDAVERGDSSQRRAAVKRALDIVIHLQATLKMANSREKFEQVIACVRNVRGAWREAAKDSNAIPAMPRPIAVPALGKAGFDGAADAAAGSNWTA